MNEVLSFIESQRQKDIERDALCANLEKQCKQKDIQLENMKHELEDCKSQIKNLTEKVAHLSSLIERTSTKGEQSEQTSTKSEQSEQTSIKSEQSEQTFTKSEQIERTSTKSEQSEQNEEKESTGSSFTDFFNESDTKGIISTLGDSVTITAGGYHNQDHPVSFLRNDDKNCFANFHVISQIEKSDGYILFDFGSLKIDLTSYLIRSNGGAPSSYAHPKTWRIEGSNNKSEWKLIDRRINDQSLNGKFHQNKFTCQYNNHGEKDGYRYIKYSQEENWLNDYRFNSRICLSRFELYGDILKL